MSTVIAKSVTKAAAPIILLTAVALLFQGHNLPGGGFIGGVLTVAALGLIYIMFSIDYLEDDLMNRTHHSVIEKFDHTIQEDYRDMFAVGLALAAGTGIVATVYGLPFLTHTFWVFHWPIYTEMHIASALFFDLGVYFVVVGGLLTILSAVGEE
jgi:multicomponent Na+:H+ antiporter subunit B